MAKRGTLFTRACAQQAVCPASRTGFLTDCRPATTTVDCPFNNVFTRQFMPVHPLLPLYFSRNGHEVCVGGKIHHGGTYDLKETGFQADHLEGASPVPLLKVSKISWKEVAFSQWSRNNGVEGFSVRTARYRYSEWRETDGTILARELHDHASDPGGSTNLASEDQCSRRIWPRAWRSAFRRENGSPARNPSASRCPWRVPRDPP